MVLFNKWVLNSKEVLDSKGILDSKRGQLWPVAGCEAAAAKPLGGDLGGAGAPPSITSLAIAMMYAWFFT